MDWCKGLSFEGCYEGSFRRPEIKIGGQFLLSSFLRLTASLYKTALYGFSSTYNC